jgi:hypothetical protein
MTCTLQGRILAASKKITFGTTPTICLASCVVGAVEKEAENILERMPRERMSGTLPGGFCPASQCFLG